MRSQFINSHQRPTMALTVRKYVRFMKFGLPQCLKSRRRQYPLIKRNSHHRFRKANVSSDQLTFVRFNHQYKHHQKENIKIGTIRNGRYSLQNYFEDFNRGKYKELSMRAQLQMEIQKQKKYQKEGFYTLRVGKNGLFRKDLFLMAWKMINRRGTIEPFRGHRQKGQLYKREALQF